MTEKIKKLKRIICDIVHITLSFAVCLVLFWLLATSFTMILK